MEHHRLLSDADFEQQFLELSLPPSWFSHEAHLRLAWILIRTYGQIAAEEKLCSQIRAFDQRHGKGTVFNKTVTIAAAKIMQHFIDKSTSKDFAGLLEEFPRLKNNFRGLIEAHYSVNIFGDSLAKLTYLEPDLIPFS
jgi:hypothetical protein